MDAETFIAKWQGVKASELSTSQSFLLDLCALLGVDKPHPTPEQDYLFERPISFAHGDGSTSAGRIDLYRRGHFVLESKKLKAGAHTRAFDEALLRARSQAEGYARALPASEGRPPFLVVVDVGQRIELYAEFSRSGGTYTPFPDPRSHRITLDDLRRPEIIDLLPLLRVAHGNDAPEAGQTREDAKRAFEDSVLDRLVTLNAERAAAEARGEVLWLRPEFQNPAARRAPAQAEIDTGREDDAADDDEPGITAVPALKPASWPKEPVALVRAVAEVLAASRVPMTVDDIAARFTSRGPWKKRLPALLDMLAAVGRATPDAEGVRWSA